MTNLKTAHGSALFALALLGAWLGGASSASAEGGYNNMDIKSVYYDSGQDRANSAVMLQDVARNAFAYGERRSAQQRHRGHDGRPGSHFQHASRIAGNDTQRQ